MAEPDVTQPNSKPARNQPAAADDQRLSQRPWFVSLPLYGAVFALAAFAAFLGWRAFAPDGGLVGRVGGLNVAPVDAPAIGGPFTLTAHTGERVTDANFRGRILLVYFGFTYCPDVCPTTLTTMADAVKLLGADAERVQPLFITVDPKRDTPEQLALYVPFFDEHMVGLTGSDADIAAVAKAYRVYYAQVPSASGAADDYVMDHTSIIYLIGTDGRYVSHFNGARAEPEAIARAIRGLL
jgi:cytochrome oxidase Cu insertion factor (SCO1/SenC/PrrC family)